MAVKFNRLVCGGGETLDENEVYKILAAADWNSLGRKLTAVAHYHARRYGWNSGDPSILGRGNQPEDIAQTVILKALSGERKWNPDKLSLERWLLGQVRSEVDNLFRNLGHRKEVSTTFMAFEDEQEESYQDAIEFTAQELEGPSLGFGPPEVELLRKEYIEERSSLIYDSIDGSHEHEQFIDTVIQMNTTKPQELSDALGWSIEKVNYLLRRFRQLNKRVQK